MPASSANTAAPSSDTATLAGGCFWCLEAVYDQVRGVQSVESGYIGGAVPNPSYETVCAGRTGHAEAVRITFDPRVVSYRDLLEVFFAIHDPTTLNRQGGDAGTQYRSAIYFHSPEQEEVAAAFLAELAAEAVFPRPVVTELTAAGTFYEAEPYHQEYFAKNPGQGYCSAVVAPKVAKFRQKFTALMK